MQRLSSLTSSGGSSGGSSAGFMDDLIRAFLGSNQQAALFNLFPQAGGTTPFSDFLRGSLGRLFNAYQGQLPTNPNQLFQDFLGRQNLQQQFQNLAPRQRGENQSMFSPQVRFSPRRFV